MGGEGRGANRRVPEATVVRLPVYQRILADLLQSGTNTVSSEELADRAGVNAAKVRKDFSLFGSFGTRGTGYDTAFLASQIERALGADRDWPIVIVGVGNLGRALANSDGFRSHGFRVGALYDVDPSVVGTTVSGCTVQHLDELTAAGAAPSAGPPAALAPIGVIATPATAAQSVADLLVAVGADAILNFAPRVLVVVPGVLVRNVDLSIELQAMSFFLVRRGSASGATDLRTGAATS
ncbi:MAG: redox-sensing transcriptional repressor Rex [Acidimicrobiales bacterium]